eukprot:scaffold16054_cov127-Isochrysis_galbana.AAC.4
MGQGQANQHSPLTTASLSHETERKITHAIISGHFLLTGLTGCVAPCKALACACAIIHRPASAASRLQPDRIMSL